MIEMEKEFMENPEAALKKYGAEALEKMKGGKTEKKEGGTLEKVAPIAALGITGTALFNRYIKDRLPPSISKNLTGLDDKTFLGKLAKNRALRLLGIS